MRGIAVPFAVACAIALPATATAQTTPELTPDGPATLMNRWTGAVPAIAFSPGVLLGARVVVGEGGRAGTVRVRARSREGSVSPPIMHAGVGPAAELPAAPGTYLLPAPRIHWQYETTLGIDQTTGGHALIERRPCTPERGPYADWCKVQWLDVFAGDPPPGPDGTPTEQRGGENLRITPISESDRDEDLLGDATEDRTDLRLSATPSRDADGRLRVAVTVTNAGPLRADEPKLTPTFPKGVRATWEPGCQRGEGWRYAYESECLLAPLAVGASYTATLVSEMPVAGTVALDVGAEGPDLIAADNRTEVKVDALPVVSVDAVKTQHLRRGVKVRVSAVRAGRARVTVAFGGTKVRLARTVKLVAYTPRTITLRASGAKLRALRAATPLVAEVTVRRLGGKPADTTKLKVS